MFWLHREGRALPTDELTDKGTVFPPLSGFMKQLNQTQQLLQFRADCPPLLQSHHTIPPCSHSVSTAQLILSARSAK